jgi:melibiose permease
MTLLFYILGCLGGIGQGLFFSAIYGMIPDCGEYALWMNGKRSDGFLYSFTSILMKWGHAVIGAVTAGVLAMLDYVPNVEQPADVLLGINVLMCVIPGVLCAINIIPLSLYKIDRKVFARIITDINSGNIGKGERMPGV